ncbi:TonB-dependent receptor [Pseudomonas sp. 3A(2025)]
MHVSGRGFALGKKSPLCLALMIAAGQQVHAADELPAITVTANALAQSVESVPGAVSAFEGQTLEQEHVEDLPILMRRVPGFVFQPFGQSGILPPVVRGISSNFASYSSSTLLMVDGVPTFMAQGFDHDMLGIERVEVLRGPQSALYGRNAEAGVVNIHTRVPDETTHARLSTEIGSRNKHAVRADLSGPLVTDTLFLGVTGHWSEQDGYIDDDLNGGRVDDRRKQGGRLALRWKPNERSEAILRYSQQSFDDGAAQWGASGSRRVHVNSGVKGYDHSRARTLSLDLSTELDSGIKLRSVTGKSDYYDRVLQDTDFQRADLLHIGRDNHFQTLSQQFTVEGTLGDSQWVTGLYLDRDRHDLGGEQKTLAYLLRYRSELEADTAALFSHWMIPLAERWTLTLGARAEKDRVRFTPEGGTARYESWKRFSPKIAVQYQWLDNAYVYASVADGFRAGSFNTLTASANYPAYAPEKVRAWELGLKGSALDRRLLYSAALYTMGIDDMQVQQMLTPGVVYIANAASARSSGLELEADYLLGAGWKIQAAVAFNRTRFDSFTDGAGDYSHNSNPFAPDLTGHLGLRYDADNRWYAQAGLSAVSKTYLDAANLYSRAGYGLIDVQVGKRFGQFDISAYVANLADKDYDAVGYQNGYVDVYSPPRELGVRLSFEL